MRRQSVAATFLLLLTYNTILAQDSTSMQVGGKPHRQKAVPPWYVERFSVSAGIYLPVSNTDLTIGSLTQSGTPLNFEKDLGYGALVASYFLQAQWRASRRSSFDLSFYRINRKSEYVLDRDIVFGDDVFHAHLAARSYFNTNIYRFAYRYSLICKPRGEAGIIAGAHIMKAGVGISLDIEITGLSLAEDLGITAPLPDIGI